MLLYVCFLKVVSLLVLYGLLCVDGWFVWILYGGKVCSLVAQCCMFQWWMVCFLIWVKIRFFIIRLMMIMKNRFEKILVVFSWLWFLKMYQFRLFVFEDMLKISLVVISVCQVKVQFILRLVRMLGKVVGIRIDFISEKWCNLQFWLIMCSVLDIVWKLLWVLSVIVYSIECISMKMMLLVLRLNQISVSGNSVMVGSGLNIEVSVFSRLLLMCELMVIVVSSLVSRMFRLQLISSVCIDMVVCCSSMLLLMLERKVCIVLLKLGKSKVLFSQWLQIFQIRVSISRIMVLCSQFMWYRDLKVDSGCCILVVVWGLGFIRIFGWMKGRLVCMMKFLVQLSDG